MAIPSGSGTEVLKRVVFRRQDEDPDPFHILDGVANHIYTIISITFFNHETTVLGINLMIDPSAVSGDRIMLTYQTATTIPGHSTFIWNDKFVLSGTDQLIFTSQDATTGVDGWVSYIDQDWT